jgi:hypothetical protein
MKVGGIEWLRDMIAQEGRIQNWGVGFGEALPS